MPSAGPLTGVRAVVLAGMGPTPYLSMLLADMGAQVVRVMRPTTTVRELAATEGLESDRDVVNRGGASVEADLKDPTDLDSVLELASMADIFIEGFRPGVAERLGLGPDVLLELNPAVVYARLTGYGQTGPRAQDAGHDINYVAQSGVLHALAGEGERPRPPINLLGDYAGGGMLAAFGVTAALYEASVSGHGQVLDCAMVDGVALLSAKLQGLRAAGLYADEPGTNFLDSGAPFYDTYACADGKFIAVGALETEFFRNFVTGLGVDSSDWPEQYDREQWPVLRARIASVLARRTRDEWASVFAGSDACVTPVLTFDEAAAETHNAERDLYTRVRGVLHPCAAPRMSRTPGREPNAPPPATQSIEELTATWSRTGWRTTNT